MKRYKIMVYTIQGQQLFFCHWKMGNSYSTRLVSHRGDAIWYTDEDVDYAENYLKTHIEQLQIKTYSVESITYQPTSVKASKQPNTTVFRGDAKHIERYGSIL